MSRRMLRSEESEALALRSCVWQTSSMKTSLIYPQCHQDRKAQKLLDRSDKMLHAKGTNQNSLQAASPKQCPSTAEQESSSGMNVR
jgi:hypothetical protein